MIGIVKNISTSLNKGIRICKVLFMGKSDVREAKQIASFGIDSNPTPDKRGLFVSTTTLGKYYTIGIINTNCKAEVGETRLFSTDENGNFKFNLWLRTDGTILMGDSDQPSAYTNYGVKFNEFKTEFNSLKTTVNDLVAKSNANAILIGTHVHPYINVVTPATTSASGTPGQSASANTSNIDNAKNDKIKTN